MSYLDAERRGDTIIAARTAAALACMVAMIVGLLIGNDIGQDREHDRICNSPQPPYTAPVAIPACGVYPR